MTKTINEAAEVEKTVVVEVLRVGEKILIPENLSIEQVVATLILKQQEEEQVVALNCEFETFVWDGAYALGNALDAKFGWYRGMTTPGSFFSPSMPPALRTIKTGTDSDVQVPGDGF